MNSVRYKQVATTDWNIDCGYDIGTVVKYDGNDYVSLKVVPVGINIGFTDYWKKITVENDIDSLQSDVEDLQEDVEKLNYNNFGTNVDISSYDSTSNLYTIPSDGYIFINARNNTTGYIRVYVGGNTSDGFIGTSINVTGLQQMSLINVKKGMKCFVSTELSEIITAFVPVVE